MKMEGYCLKTFTSKGLNNKLNHPKIQHLTPKHLHSHYSFNYHKNIKMLKFYDIKIPVLV